MCTMECPSNVIQVTFDHSILSRQAARGSLRTGVNRRRVESTETSKVSMMPAGLLDTLKEDEILDLMAYLLSRGDRGGKMFK